MEIERKFLVKELPEKLEQYKCKVIEQGYLCRKPTEVEVPLGREGYEHLKEKLDGYLIAKKRYLIPLTDELTAELDIFEGRLKGLVVVEVEFKDEEAANSFCPPEWFGEDVSLDSRYTNGNLSTVEAYNF